MKILTILFVSCLFGIPSHATPATSTFDSAKWEQLKAYAAKNGTPKKSPYGIFHVLSSMRPPDPNQPHEKDMFSAVGDLDKNGIFQATFYQDVSEDWQIDTQHDNNWNVDQWILIVNDDASVNRVWHYQYVLSQDGKPLRVLAISNTPEEDKAHLDQQLEEWEARVLPVEPATFLHSSANI